MNNKLDNDYYLDADVVQLAKAFLGKKIHTHINGIHSSGKIVEVEAYCGARDRACHAFPDKQTARTKIMYMQGGIAYVYLVYGMHHLFNIVTNVKGKADAVLIRAIEPMEGLEAMMSRRRIKSNDKILCGGPARLTQALGISVADDMTDLLGNRIWISPGEEIEPKSIISSTRIGVEYAGEDALLPWRFHIKNNKYVSK